MSKNYEHLRTRLVTEKKRLDEELEVLESANRPSETRREGSPFGKREEEATETLELEKRVALEKQIGEHLTEVERALHKFEEGNYGLCDSCGKPIATDRLEALPQAGLCVECKAKNAKGRVSPG
ncbi:MAG: TraR/DksA C4-type zinc finger protein [Dehalococcoidales bacterium]